MAAKSNLIISTVKRLGGRGTWTQPTFEAPQLISAESLSPLGVYRGRAWFTCRYGEAETGRTFTDADVLPDTILTMELVAGERVHVSYRVHEPGTFERLSTAVHQGPRPKPAHRPVDALGALFLSNRQAEIIVPPTAGPDRGLPALMPAGADGPHIRPGKPPVRGAEALLARLASKGATVTLSADGTSMVVTSSGGRPRPGVSELVQVAGPLILAYLRDGKAPDCTVSAHKVAQPASTVVLGGALACAACMAGGA